MRKLLLASAALAALSLSFGVAQASPVVAIGADIQLNVAPQVAQTNIGAATSVQGKLTANTQAIGNDLSVTATSKGIALGVEVQGNVAPQFAETNVSGLVASKAADITTTAVGDAVSVTASKGLALNAGLQINAAPQVALTNIGANQFQGPASFSTAAVGNDISVTGKYAVNLGLQANLAPQFAETNIGGTAGVAAVADTTTTSTHNTYLPTFFGPVLIGSTTTTVDNHDGSPAIAAIPVSFGGDVTVDTDAVGNLSSVTGTKLAFGAGLQVNAAPQVAVTNIDLATFSKSLTINTVAAGNVANVSAGH